MKIITVCLFAFLFYDMLLMSFYVCVYRLLDKIAREQITLGGGSKLECLRAT